MADRPPRRRRTHPVADTGPRRVGDSIDDVVHRLGGRDASGLAVVFARWDEIAGPSLARHVRPVRLSDGVLVVAVSQPAWATHVRALGGELLAKVGEATGQRPTRLEVTVRRV